ncbi:MAG: hypothetical protein AVO33_10270 [delta proteobacterium ML8_F1]|nr:MAG: hypothetical protein AVO33_10270 [delta proteobacterium ML8_F1]
MKGLGLLVLMILLTGLSGCSPEPAEAAAPGNPTNQTRFYQPALFVKTLSGEEETLEGVKGIIVPHHLTASAMIHRTFNLIRNEPYETVIILGPDHYRENHKQIATGKRDWETDFGRLAVSPLGEVLAQRMPLVRLADDDLEKEHSVGALIPYVAYYFPQANVLPVTFSTSLSLEDTLDFAEDLLELTADGQGLLVASVDFSHGLSYEAARAMDLKTRKMIDRMEYKRLNYLGNDSLDSPETLMVFLWIMENLGAGGRLLEASNSSEVLGIRGESTTGYMTYLFQSQ